MKTSDYLGLDLGSATVKVALLDSSGNICRTEKKVHHGYPLRTAKELLYQISKEYDCLDCLVGVSGANAGFLVSSKEEYGDIPAIHKGMEAIFGQAGSLIEIGAQNVRFLTGLGKDIPPQFAENGSCAGGTGSFFEDQMYRLGFDLEQYSELVSEAKTVPRLSGRCSVFAKTDIIHRQQEGVTTPDILLGLCFATARNIKASIIGNLPVEKPVALCGGIIYNKGMLHAVKEVLELTDDELLVSEACEYVQAVGTARLAMDSGQAERMSALLARMDILTDEEEPGALSHRLPALKLVHEVPREPKCVPLDENGQKCSLGLDVGSTSTNLVLVNEAGKLVDYQYLRTKGNPEGAVREGLQNIREKFGDSIVIGSVGVTGSGRYLIGKLVGADSIIDEITAQGRAAACVCPEVDTVFEIGGQDSKYISLEHGKIKDFQMNKICAAGTGSFIEEQAGRLNVPVTAYGEMALQAKHPVDLGERCTVFIESNITSCLAKGTPVPDILAGLCYSVIYNYLHKVVGNKKVGEHIVLQGGVCYNQAVVAAFESVYGDRVAVSPYFSVSGAYGVAVVASEEIGGKKTSFRGLTLEQNPEMIQVREEQQTEQNVRFYQKAKEYFLDGYERRPKAGKQVVGIPYVLLVHKFFPMFRRFFESLGYQVLLSPETDETIVGLSQQHAQAETCYPVKLIYGHMVWLAEQKVDFIFMPGVLTMKHESSKVYHNYGCVYMQSAPRVVFNSLHLEKQGIRLLNPLFSLDFGKQAMAEEMLQIGKQLGISKVRCMAALMKGAQAVRECGIKTERLGKSLLEQIKPEDKVLVIVTRTYGIEDPVLNMGIPEELLRKGCKVITLSHLPAHDLDLSDEYENLYWPFGQHIISGAKLIASHPNLYAVYLTNHGCGPDTMLSHLFRAEMGDKPYLNIEVDEHFSKVGVITRIEAFLNSLANQKTEKVECAETCFANIKRQSVHLEVPILKELPVRIPHLWPYSDLIASVMRTWGYDAAVLPELEQESLREGQRQALTKEYLPYIALSGALKTHQKCGQPVQFLIPQTEGSETDGVYGRVLYEELVKESQDKLITRTLETLLWSIEPKRAKELVLAIMTGDLILAAEPGKRKQLLEKCQEQAQYTKEAVVELANAVKREENADLAVVGDPYVLYHSFLHDGVLEELESRGYRLNWMPLGEYLVSMWQKRTETEKQRKLVGEWKDFQQKIGKILEGGSPYSLDLDAFMQKAEAEVRGLTGGNIAYRYGKALDEQGRKAVIHVCSMYENAQTILELCVDRSRVPMLTLNFEGNEEVSSRERLASFLYFLKSR